MLVRKTLCALGIHKWFLVYEDEQEKFYTCIRKRPNEDVCPAFFTVEKGDATV